MFYFTFTQKAKKYFETMELLDQNRVIKKLQSFKNLSNIDHIIKIVHNLEPATHRIRIGKFRLLVKVNGEKIYILKIGLRKEIYK